MSIKEFRLDRKSAGAQGLEGLWGPGPPADLLYDMSLRGRPNHATRVGTGNPWVPSERGIVMQFNGGSDAFNCEFNLGLGTEAFTVMGWAWLDSTVASGAAALMGEGKVLAGEWAYSVTGSNGVNAQLNFYGDIGDINAKAPITTYIPLMDTWAHIVAVRIVGGACMVYQNGILMHTDAVAGDNLNVAKVLQIGCADSGGGRWWKGMLDDIRYYSRALSIAQIEHIYRTTQHTPYADIALRPTRRYVQRHRAEAR